MHIEPIKAIDRISEAWPLLEAHRNELATYKHLMILNPDIDKYKKLDEAKCLIGLGLFDGDKIVGYSIFFLTNALHYADLTMGQNDIIYVHPDYRHTRWGIKLIQASEEAMRLHDRKMITWHGKEDTAFSSLMPKLGYIVQDIVFSKEL